MINLDGLVNDSVYPYVISGRMADYVAENKIAYIVDFPSMLDAEGGRRGGYADGLLASCLTPVRTFGGKQTFNGNKYTLMKVDQACLAAGKKPAPR